VKKTEQDTPVAINRLHGDASRSARCSPTDKRRSSWPNLQFATNSPLAGNNASSHVFIFAALARPNPPRRFVDPLRRPLTTIDDVYIVSASAAAGPAAISLLSQVLRGGPQGPPLRSHNESAGRYACRQPIRSMSSAARCVVALAAPDSLFDGFDARRAFLSPQPLSRASTRVDQARTAT